MKPAKGTKINLEATLDGEPKDGDAAFRICWKEDLAGKLNAADQVHELDKRSDTIERCGEWNELKTKINNNVAKIEAESTVPHDTWGSDTSALEIYACIRAEYKYIVSESYKKVSSRTGSNGIDHIFVKGDDHVIVESKTISDLRKIINLKTKREPDTVINVLGEGRQYAEFGNGVLYATQMSIRWLRSCLNDLAAKDNASAKKIISNWENGKPPQRVINIYGGIDWNAKGAYDELEAEAKRQYDEAVAEYDGAKANLGRANSMVEQAATSKQKTIALKNRISAGLRFNKAEREYSILPKLKKTSIAEKPYVGSKTKTGGESTGQRDFLFIHKEWGTANPKKGIFYLLPGKYDIKVRAAQFNEAEETVDTKEVDFADEKYRDEEFFELDTLPDSTLSKLEELAFSENKQVGSVVNNSTKRGRK